jgi:FkbM family methyltransferase
MQRFPSKSNLLRFLNDIGVTFGTIVDVGTHAETPELKRAFPNNRHVLFEPAEEFFPKIQENYSGLNWELFPVAVSDSDGAGRLRKVAITGGEISHSKLDYNATDSEARLEGDLGIFDVPTVRLDTFFLGRNEPKPYLLKVDVDGFEMPILRGAEGIWDDIDLVIIEATYDTLLERLEYIARRGFHLLDIVDQCYYAGTLSQVDLVLVSDRLRGTNPRLRPWETETFAWEKWIPVANHEALLLEKQSLPKEQDRPRESRGDHSTLHTAAEKALEFSELINKTAAASLFNKVAVIEACKNNPYQPSLVWHPSIFGSMMQIDLRETIAQQIYLTGAFEPDILWLMTCLVEPGMSVIDAGAHIGFFTLALGQLVGPNGRVDAFEPTPSTKIHLDTNVRNAGFTHVFTHSLAIWSEPTELQLHDLGSEFSAYNGVSAPRLPPDVKVPEANLRSVSATSIDHFVAGGDRLPSLIKLDVECAEFFAISGMRETIATAKPMIIVEIGDFPGGDMPSTYNTLELLGKLGYELYSIGRLELKRQVVSDRTYDYGNILAVHRDRLSEMKLKVHCAE